MLGLFIPLLQRTAGLRGVRKILLVGKTPEMSGVRERSLAIDRVNHAQSTAVRVVARKSHKVGYLDTSLLFLNERGGMCDTLFEGVHLSKFGRRKMVLEILRKVDVLE